MCRHLIVQFSITILVLKKHTEENSQGRNIVYILQTYFMLMNNFCSSLNINKLQKRVGRGLNPYHLFMKKDALLKKQMTLLPC